MRGDIVKNPFKFGMVVKGEDFCDRKREMEEIGRAVESKMSVTLLSPRRYGKTSLIVNLLDRLTGCKTVYLDLMAVTSLDAFLERYSSGILEALGGIRKFITKLDRLIEVKGSVGIDVGSLKLKIDIDPKRVDDAETIIDLPSKFDEKFVIVLDEFQEISNITEIDLLSVLRKKFQFFENAVFIFSGSKKTVMTEIFSDPKRPFYRFSQLYELKNLDEEESKEFVMGKFERSGIRMTEEIFSKVYAMTKGQAYYLQALCHHLWFAVNGSGILSEKTLDEALERVIFSEKTAFETLWDELTPNQKKTLKTLSEGRSPYDFKISSGSVKRALEALEKSDIVIKNGGYRIIDPIFEAWLKSAD